MRDIGDLIIILKNEKNEDIEIRTKKIDEARINFGHWKTPAATPIPKQFLVSLEKAITTSNTIFTSPVTRPEAKMLYQSVYRSTVEYPLGQSFLLDKQIKKDQISLTTKNNSKMRLQQEFTARS